MDHLPSLGFSAAIEVPYVCDEMYDGGSFSGYPQRKGWDKEKLYKGQFEGKTPQETASVLQAWMYFGLLFEVLKVPSTNFSPQDFLRSVENGKFLVTTERLPKYVREWYSRESGDSLEKRKERFDSINSCFSELHPFVMRYCGRDSWKYHEPPSFWPLSPEISLSIIVLTDSLMKAGFHITQRPFNYNWGVSGLLVDRMKGAGWCSSITSTLTTAQQVHMLYYASTMGEPMDRREHAHCSEAVCKADQTDVQSYRTMHRLGCTECPFVEPSIERVNEILEKGNIPLVTCHEVDGSLNVKVVEHSSAEPMDYVALSHVWSDGLGNPHRNALPACQLTHLQSLVNELQEYRMTTPCFWWCDTLCVPVGVDLKRYRDTAIRRMGQTYRGATKVLVLDSNLLRCQKNAHILEIYMRIKLSRWMRRLWTLQEGILAAEVYFQCSDGTRRMREVDSAMIREGALNGQFLYTRYSFDSFTLFGPFIRGPKNPQHQQLTGLGKLLQWRSTSHRADETICLATLLGLDPAHLLEIPAENYDERMAEFLRSLGKIPVSLLFQLPPRLSIPGFRWAPSSLLACFKNGQINPYRAIRGTAEIGPEGRSVYVVSAGLELDLKKPSTLRIGDDFFLRPLPEKSAHLYRGSYIGPVDSGQPDRNARNIDGSRNLRKPAIILSQPLTSRNAVDGLLVDLCEGQSERSCLQCYFIAWIGLQRVGVTSTAALGLEGDKSNIIFPKHVAENQKWMIDPPQNRESREPQTRTEST